MLCIIYLLIRPIITQNLEPVIKDAAGERINGTLTWTMMDLDPNYDLSFTDLELKDEKGEVVFKSPSLEIGWSASALYNYAFKAGNLAGCHILIRKTRAIHFSRSHFQGQCAFLIGALRLPRSAHNAGCGNPDRKRRKVDMLSGCFAFEGPACHSI